MLQVFLLFLLSGCVWCEELMQPSQLGVVMLANSEEFYFQLKDRSNLSVVIRPTRTVSFLTLESQEVLDEYKNELATSYLTFFYEFGRSTVRILERYLENKEMNLEEVHHSQIYRYIYDWYKYIEDPEAPEAFKSSEINELITRLPRSIGFPDLSLRIVQKVTHDLSFLMDYSEDKKWMDVVEEIKEAEAKAGDFIDEHSVWMISNANSILVKTYNVHPLELYSSDINNSDDIPLSNLVSAASSAFSRHNFNIALEWLHCAQELLDTTIQTLRDKVREQNEVLMNHYRHINAEQFFYSKLRNKRDEFEFSRKPFVLRNLLRISKLAPNSTKDLTRDSLDKKYSAMYIDLFIYSTINFHEQYKNNTEYTNVYGMFFKPIKEVDFVTQSSKIWKEKKLREYDPTIEVEYVNSRHEMLCRGIDLRSVKERSRYACRFDDRGSSYLKLMPAKLEEVNSYPKVFIFHDVVNHDWIQELQTIALTTQGKAETSDSTLSFLGKSKTRKSFTSWISDAQNSKASSTSILISHLTGLNVYNNNTEYNAESFQMNVYESGGFYIPHRDSFNVFGDIINEESTVDELLKIHPEGDRIATVMIYLNDDFIGGRTAFPHLGLSIEPVKGSAVYWENLSLDGKEFVESLHAGCPVLAGTKWVTNKWIKSNPQMFLRPCGLDKDGHEDLNIEVKK